MFNLSDTPPTPLKRGMASSKIETFQPFNFPTIVLNTQIPSHNAKSLLSLNLFLY